MKDFISKLTFGFLMAQFLPGSVVVFSSTYLACDISKPHCSIKQHFSEVGEYWFESIYLTIVFLFLSVAIGMVVHGLNWTVLAWLESKYDSSRESFWHQKLLIIQVFLSPIKMIIELLWLLIAPNIEILTLMENVHKIKKEKMEQFYFLQEFYLNFSQFYAHMSYAFLITFIFSIICCVQNFSWKRLAISIVFYFLTSLFFLLGRIQLGSLFKAERDLFDEKNK